MTICSTATEAQKTPQKTNNNKQKQKSLKANTMKEVFHH